MLTVFPGISSIVKDCGSGDVYYISCSFGKLVLLVYDSYAMAIFRVNRLKSNSEIDLKSYY